MLFGDRTIRLVLSSFFISSSLSGVVSSPAPSATNVYGKDVTYRGLYTNEIEGFIGIRYGQYTSGENRFRPPKSHSEEMGSTIDVTAPGPSCPQRVDHQAPSIWNRYD